MTDATLSDPIAPAAKRRILVQRHSLLVRITHWINALSLFLMLMSGLNIFNAHPALYWGQKAQFAAPWLSIRGMPEDGRMVGVTQLGPLKFDTTGVLGVSKTRGVTEIRAFPAYTTVPGDRSLALARRWHFFWAWIFAINGVIYIGSALLNGHLRRDLFPGPKDLKNLWRDIVDHARLRFHKGWEATRYGVLQRIAYFATGWIVLPLVILTGMTMSPGLNAAFPFMLDLFGGRQSARSIHFICAALIVLFIIVHLVMVLLTGPLNQVRAMITGKYAIVVDEGDERTAP